MNTLADYTSAESIVPRLRGDNGSAALLDLGTRVAQAVGADVGALLEAVERRELSSPNIDARVGWAFPHARVARAANVRFAFGSAATPLAWFGAETRVTAVFLFVIPEHEIEEYLSAIGGLARMSGDPRLRQELENAYTAESILAIFRQVPLRSKPSLAFLHKG